MAKPIRIERTKPAKASKALFDFRLGFALLRDRRTPAGAKVFALTIGFIVVVLAELLEIPVEEILIAVIPVIGFLGDMLFAGLEFILGPILLASWMLPYLVPSNLLDQVRYERAKGDASPPEKPIIDV